MIIGYSTLFKSQETEWMLTLPVRSLDVFRWKLYGDHPAGELGVPVSVGPLDGRLWECPTRVAELST